MRGRVESSSIACAALVRLSGWCAAGILGLWLNNAQAYSSLYVFGDSLSDSGNVFAVTSSPGLIGDLLPNVPAAPYFQGRFSNGLNFADVLNMGLFSQPLTPFLRGGTNFAVGGATTGLHNAAVPTGGLIPPTGMLAQLTYYVRAPGFAGADPNALYLVYGGANDMFTMLEAAAADPVNAESLKDHAIRTSISNLAVTFGSLARVGAVHFLLPNLPDLGTTPRYYQTPMQSFATQASQEFNSAYGLVVGRFDEVYSAGDIRQLDVYGLLNTALADPGQFGFSRLHTPCYPGNLFNIPPLAPCANPDEYIFWDEIHPTAAVHAFLGKEALRAALVPEPASRMLLVGGLLLLVASVRQRGRTCAG